MMTGGSASSASGGGPSVSGAERRCDAGLSGLRCLRLRNLLVFLATGLDLSLLLLSPTTLGGDDGDGEDGPLTAPAWAGTASGEDLDRSRRSTRKSLFSLDGPGDVGRPDGDDEGLPAELIF